MILDYYHLPMVVAKRWSTVAYSALVILPVGTNVEGVLPVITPAL